MSQRTIKFRVWDKDKGMSRSFNFNEIGEDNGRQYIDGYGRIYEDMIYMQFTGLLDKNGKEIYEGDIVQYGGMKAQVHWDKYMWNVVDYYNSSFDSPGDAFSEGVFEIIGNIYENPNLLK